MKNGVYDNDSQSNVFLKDVHANRYNMYVANNLNIYHSNLSKKARPDCESPTLGPLQCVFCKTLTVYKTDPKAIIVICKG